MHKLASLLGSFFLFAAFILSLLVLIGQLSNKPLIKKMSFGQAYYAPLDTSYNFGLWNYCTEQNGQILSCEKAKPAYDWARAPPVTEFVPNQASSGMVRSLFMALFTLYFIGTGLNLIFWLMSLPVIVARRRALGFSMTTLVFINFLVFLVILILALVVTLRGIYLLNRSSNDWSGYAGYSMWFTIGIVASLLFALLTYAFGSAFSGRNRDRNRVGVSPFSNKKQATVPMDSPNYNHQSTPYQTPQLLQKTNPYNMGSTGAYTPTQPPPQQPMQSPAQPSAQLSTQQPMQQRPYETPTLSHAQPSSSTNP